MLVMIEMMGTVVGFCFLCFELGVSGLAFRCVVAWYKGSTDVLLVNEA